MLHKFFLIPFFCLLLTGCYNPNYDQPPLHDAAKRGRLSKVQKLLKEGANPNALNKEGATPLHWAAFKGRLEVAEYLLNNGARVNVRTKKGSTPLKLAIEHKQKKMAQFLKKRGGQM